MKTIHVGLMDETHGKLLKIRDILHLDNLNEAVATAIEKTYAIIKEEQT